MPDLVAVDELKNFLDVSGGSDDELLTDLLEYVEDVFEGETGRTDAPLVAAATARTEVHDGTGCETIFLDYPISDVTTVKLGQDVSDPIETLDPTDIDELTFGAGSRKLTRTDGGIFGLAGKPRYVHITYNHQGDLPGNAKLAIIRVVAQVYRQRGSEDAKYENVGGYIHNLSHLIAEDPLWARAVAANQRTVMA
jgi:hypothetical protein